MNSAAQGLALLVVRHARAIRIASLALLCVASLSLLRLEVDVGLVSMLPSGRPAFDDYREFVERFAEEDVALAVVRARDREDAIRFGEAFAAILSDDPAVSSVRVRSDADAFLDAVAEGGAVRFTPLAQARVWSGAIRPEAVPDVVAGLRGALALPGAAGIAPQLARDPFGLAPALGDALAAARPDRSRGVGSEYILSADGRRLLVLVQPASSGYDLPEVERLGAAFARAEAAASAETGITAEVGVTGAFAYAAEDAAVMRADLIRYTLVAFCGVLFVFLLAVRQPRLLPVLAFHLVLGSLVTLAAGLLIFGRLDVLSLAFAAIFYGLAVDAAIHLAMHLQEQRRGQHSEEQSLYATYRLLFAPILVASLTTAAAFGVLGFASLTGIAQLGVLSAIGIAWNAIGTLVVLPALLLGSAPSGAVPPEAHRLGRLAERLSARRRRGGLVVGAFLLALFLGIPHVEVETDLFSLRPRDSRAAQVQEELEREFGMTDPHGSVMLSVRSPLARESEEALLAGVQAVTDHLRARQADGGVLSVTSPAVFLPSRAQQEERIALWRSLPRAATAERLEEELTQAGFAVHAFAPALATLREVPQARSALAQPLPGTAEILAHHVRADSAMTSVLVSFTPRDVDALVAEALLLEEQVDWPDGVAVRVAGRPLLERELARAFADEAFLFPLLIFGFAVVVLAVTERDLRTAASLVLMPILAVGATLGAAGWIGIPLNPANGIVLPLVAGIALDDGLFLRARLREQGSMGVAMRLAGRALVATTLTTVVGFGALSLSHYPALAHMGELAAAGLALAFFVVAAVLPLLLTEERGR